MEENNYHQLVSQSESNQQSRIDAVSAELNYTSLTATHISHCNSSGTTHALNLSVQRTDVNSTTSDDGDIEVVGDYSLHNLKTSHRTNSQSSSLSPQQTNDYGGLSSSVGSSSNQIGGGGACMDSGLDYNRGYLGGASNIQDSWMITDSGSDRASNRAHRSRESVDTNDSLTSTSVIQQPYQQNFKTEPLEIDNQGQDLSLSKERRRRQKLQDKDSLICVVCRDKARGNNFGAITCESCKAFFRRTAPKTKTFTCEFEGNCKLDPETRKFCTYCRLKKCNEVGMKKEWILDEDALKKRKKIYRTRKEDNTPPQPDTTQPDSSKPEEEADFPPEPMSTNDQQQLTNILDHHKILDMSLPRADQLTPEQQAQMKAMMSGASASPSGVKNNPAYQSRSYNIESGEYERYTQTPDSSAGVFNMAEGFIRRLIKFLRTLPEFRDLPCQDQVNLLKGGIMETLVLRSAIQYDPQIGGFAVSDMTNGKMCNIQLQAMRPLLGEDLYNEHMNFITTFNTAAKWDKPTMILAMIINLFSSDRPELQSKPLVERAEEKYSCLMQTYLKSIYTRKQAKLILPKILMKLTDVRTYGQMSSNAVQLIPPETLHPLMKEVLFAQHSPDPDK